MVSKWRGRREQLEQRRRAATPTRGSSEFSAGRNQPRLSCWRGSYQIYVSRTAELFIATAGTAVVAVAVAVTVAVAMNVAVAVAIAVAVAAAVAGLYLNFGTRELTPRISLPIFPSLFPCTRLLPASRSKECPGIHLFGGNADRRGDGRRRCLLRSRGGSCPACGSRRQRAPHRRGHRRRFCRLRARRGGVCGWLRYVPGGTQVSQSAAMRAPCAWGQVQAASIAALPES